jgi:5-methylcytosine-specific restriction endonuclease McrA
MPRDKLDESVLVLNKDFFAIHVTSARDAIAAVYKGAAKVIDENFILYSYDQWKGRSKEIHNTDEGTKYAGTVSSPTHYVFIPQVIQFNETDGRIARTVSIRYSRYNIFLRDNFTCQYCGLTLPKSQLTIDHIIPRAQGGKSSFSNAVACCSNCNRLKADRTPEQAGMKLIRQPTEPKWKSYTGLAFDDVKKQYWNRFL